MVIIIAVIIVETCNSMHICCTFFLSFSRRVSFFLTLACRLLCAKGKKERKTNLYQIPILRLSIRQAITSLAL